MNIKNLIRLFAFVLLCGANILTTQAQSNDNSNSKDKIESLKRSYVITESKMTPDEVNKFWPLYEEFLAKKKAIKPNESGSGADADRARADLKDEYYQKYIAVMPKEKVDIVLNALIEFRGKIAEEIKEDRKP